MARLSTGWNMSVTNSIWLKCNAGVISVPIEKVVISDNEWNRGRRSTCALKMIVHCRVFDFETNLDGIANAHAAMDEQRAIKSLLRVSHV
jgi:hypothetical protein